MSDLDLFNVFTFDNGHFWNRHLACYIGSNFTNAQFDIMVAQDFWAQIQLDGPPAAASAECPRRGSPYATDRR
jgi:hypothetical protein